MNKTIVILGVLVVIALALFLSAKSSSVLPPTNTETQDVKGEMKVSTEYGFSFTYQDEYVAVVEDTAPSGDLVFAQMVFDADEYQELKESTVPREAPVSLTIEVFRNPMNLEAQEWVMQNERSNYQLSQDGDTSTVMLGDTDFLTYTYDGLYRTNAYVYAQEGYVYIFSNMLADGDGPMRSDMEELLRTVEWSTPKILAQVAHGDIRVTSPEVGGEITSPLMVEGQARGTWFFEATFPLVLVNWDGLIIAEGYAQAEGEWMTEEFVPFKGELVFTKPPYDTRGTLILQKDNPSGLPEHDDAIEIPVVFK